MSQCSRSMSTSCPYQTQATNHFDKGDTKIIDTIALKSPLKIIFLGAPGSGKGTYSGIISKSLGHLPIYSTGDLLRDEIQHKTEIGLTIKEITETGGLVSDDIVMRVLLNKLEQDDRARSHGFILDGFPRSASQAESLSTYDNGSLAPSVVINVDLKEDVIVQKLLGRRNCSRCGGSANLAKVYDEKEGYDMPALPPPSQCDHLMIPRADDTEEVIRERLKVYYESTQPLIGLYREQGLLIDFVVKKGLKDVPQLVDSIANFPKLQL